MSHIVEAKTSVKHPDAVLLRQAVELVAEQHSGGRLADYYLSYARKRQTAHLAIFTDVITRGIALRVKETGELTFVGDPFLYEEQAEAIQQHIVQTYVSLATMQALQHMGYAISAEDGEEGQVILTGVNQYV